MWVTPLACGPGSPELSKAYMDMASKVFFTYIYVYNTENPLPQRGHAAPPILRSG